MYEVFPEIGGAGRGGRPAATMLSRPGIVAIGEFVDCLRHLLRGHVLVRVSDFAGWTSLAGSPVHHSFPALEAHGLIQEFDNPAGFVGVHYYRMTRAGREFAQAALRSWFTLPLRQRMLLRLMR